MTNRYSTSKQNENKTPRPRPFWSVAGFLIPVKLIGEPSHKKRGVAAPSPARPRCLGNVGFPGPQCPFTSIWFPRPDTCFLPVDSQAHKEFGFFHFTDSQAHEVRAFFASRITVVSQTDLFNPFGDTGVRPPARSCTLPNLPRLSRTLPERSVCPTVGGQLNLEQTTFTRPPVAIIALADAKRGLERT